MSRPGQTAPGAEHAYQPSRGLAARVRRRIVPHLGRRDVALHMDRPVVSFTFDDVPASVPEHALPVLEREGWRGTLYVATGLIGLTNHHGRMMSAAEIREAAARGHEIGAHSHRHIDYGTASAAVIAEDMRMAGDTLAEVGVREPTAFAWPYGEASAQAKRRLGARYGSLRGTRQITHRTCADLNQLGSYRLFSGRYFDELHAAIGELGRAPGWLTLFTHDVRERPSPWGCTPGEFEAVVAAVKRVGAAVLPVGAAVAQLKGSPDE